jgi:DNA-directed RNA polymerase subunit H (RpoH/RPB5)
MLQTLARYESIKKLYNAPSEAERKEILKYVIEEADLDNNPDTRDSVIVCSDRKLGKIHLIYRYQLTSGQKKIN